MPDEPEVNLRPPSEVMKLERLGSFHASRISFARTLIRRMHNENWRITQSLSNLDSDGFGDMVYRIDTPEGPLSFIAFSTPLDDKDRTDRVIAEKWDMSFALHHGAAGREDVDRLRRELPKQEAGRMSTSEIVMSRANKSVRVFQTVAQALADGRQPSAAQLAQIGYLVRTTAVYGNGKFGLMDFKWVRRDTPFKLPFQAEMLTVFMARHFSLDLVQHIADRQSDGSAIQLDRKLKRLLGVGNATGLGMAPFLISHPKLIHRWIMVRETAIARVRSVTRADERRLRDYAALLDRVKIHIEQWQTQDARQLRRLGVLRQEIDMLRAQGTRWLEERYPWSKFADRIAASMSTECVELAHSIMLELHPECVDDLEHELSADETSRVASHMTLGEMKALIESNYSWAIDTDFDDPDEQHFFWYVSAEKEEPRLGERYREPGKELELKIGIGREVARLHQCLLSLSGEELRQSAAQFLIEFPRFRFIVSRIHSLKDCPYGEIQDNLLGRNCLPIDLLRCKLALFGATRFDPKSDRWTRITLFQGAPLADELENSDADDWAFPVVAGL